MTTSPTPPPFRLDTLNANTAGGSVYGSTLGFTVANGQVDVSSVMLKSLQGPFVAGDNAQLPFTPVSIYRNDKVSSSAELNKYDVYYYSESLQAVWIYTRRAAGRITAVSPTPPPFRLDTLDATTVLPS